MNDQELNELLDTWSSPEAPASLRDRVRAGFAARPQPARPRWRLALWAVGFGMAAFLLVLVQAFPQTVKLAASTQKIPFTVDSDWITYGHGGSVKREMYITSYARGGREVILSVSIAGHPLETFHLWAISTAYSLWNDLVAPMLGTQAHEHSPLGELLLTSGCANGFGYPASGGQVAGHETILNYDTLKIQNTLPGRRYTVWLAPALGCFPLRETFERQQPDGSSILSSARRALKVTVRVVQ
jgi:hypothetical protein